MDQVLGQALVTALSVGHYNERFPHIISFNPHNTVRWVPSKLPFDMGGDV